MLITSTTLCWGHVETNKTKHHLSASLNARGALNFGLRAMCHQKDPTFFRSLSPKDPNFYQLSPNDPLFCENFDIFDEMLRNFGHFGHESPSFLMHFTERPPIFVCFVTERPPFLTQFFTERPLHLRCLVALVRHFHMWVPPPPGLTFVQYLT